MIPSLRFYHRTRISGDARLHLAEPFETSRFDVSSYTGRNWLRGGWEYKDAIAGGEVVCSVYGRCSWRHACNTVDTLMSGYLSVI